MLVTQGDLIPVESEATSIPWTRRKSQILNFLHRGPVDFSTLVYDTNVGDISAISTYFNPERVSVKDLNTKFGQHPSSNPEKDEKKDGSDSRKPRLLLYPEHNQINTKAQRTLTWVMSHNETTSPPPQQLSTTLPDNWSQQPSTALPDNWAQQLPQQTPDNWQQLAQTRLKSRSAWPAVKRESGNEQQCRGNSSDLAGRPLQYCADLSYSTDSLLSSDLKKCLDNPSLLLQDNRQTLKSQFPTPIGYPRFDKKVSDSCQSTSPTDTSKKSAGSCNSSSTTSPANSQTEQRDYKMWDNYKFCGAPSAWN